MTEDEDTREILADIVPPPELPPDPALGFWIACAMEDGQPVLIVHGTIDSADHLAEVATTLAKLAWWFSGIEVANDPDPEPEPDGAA